LFDLKIGKRYYDKCLQVSSPKVTYIGTTVMVHATHGQEQSAILTILSHQSHRIGLIQTIIGIRLMQSRKPERKDGMAAKEAWIG
jgi:hypothetical protein